MKGKVNQRGPTVQRVVLTMKWGRAYAPDYVNVLYGGVRAHLAGDFRFVCLTDDPTGIRPEVDCHPIPDLGLPPAGWAAGAWPKISVFQPDLLGLAGRALFIDLDSMICDDLQPMFDHPGRLVMIREWKRPLDHLNPRAKVRGASGVFGFALGDMAAAHHLLTDDPAGWVARIRNDQRYMEHVVPSRSFWPGDWVTSFKRHVLAAPIVNRFKAPGQPPAGTRILAFHGRPRPAELVPDQGQVWGDFWRHGKGAVPWFRDYWLRHGGSDRMFEHIRTDRN